MTSLVALVALALIHSAPKLTLAILPARMRHEDARVLDPKWVEPQAPSAVAEALASEARRKYVLTPADEVKDAAMAVGLVRIEAYGDAAKLEAVRVKLGVDLVVAPVVASFDWYDRPRSEVVFVNDDDLADDVDYARRNGSIFGSVPTSPRIVETRDRGHGTALFAYVCSASGMRTSKTMTSECPDSEGRPRTESDSALGAAHLLLKDLEKSARRR